jgi:hypothetical protein
VVLGRSEAHNQGVNAMNESMTKHHEAEGDEGLPPECAVCPFHRSVETTLAELKQHQAEERHLVSTVDGIRQTVDRLSITAENMSAALIGTLDKRGMVPRQLDLETKLVEVVGKVDHLEKVEIERVKKDLDDLKILKARIGGMIFGYASLAGALITFIGWLVVTFGKKLIP